MFLTDMTKTTCQDKSRVTLQDTLQSPKYTRHKVSGWWCEVTIIFEIT